MHTLRAKREQIISKKKRSRKFRATFENGGFWEYYRDLERQFEDFLEGVPYLDTNEKVCSFRLVNLLLSIGGHVDSAFKEMATYRKFSRNVSCRKIRNKAMETRRRIRRGLSPGETVKIEECLEAFEDIYKLSTREVIFKRLPQRQKIVPFDPHNPRTNAPEWWDIYNGLKHDFGSNFEKANLRITKDALAGAFLLNAIHIPGAIRLRKHGIAKLDLRAEKGIGPQAKFDFSLKFFREILEEGQPYPAFAATAVFIYDYEQ